MTTRATSPRKATRAMIRHAVMEGTGAGDPSRLWWRTGYCARLAWHGVHDTDGAGSISSFCGKASVRVCVWEAGGGVNFAG